MSELAVFLAAGGVVAAFCTASLNPGQPPFNRHTWRGMVLAVVLVVAALFLFRSGK